MCLLGYRMQRYENSVKHILFFSVFIHRGRQLAKKNMRRRNKYLILSVNHRNDLCPTSVFLCIICKLGEKFLLLQRAYE